MCLASFVGWSPVVDAWSPHCLRPVGCVVVSRRTRARQPDGPARCVGLKGDLHMGLSRSAARPCVAAASVVSAWWRGSLADAAMHLTGQACRGAAPMIEMRLAVSNITRFGNLANICSILLFTLE